MDRVKVQVVDDHFLFAQSLGSVIKDMERYELVGIAVTGPQALAMAGEERPDVILMDYHLPGYSADMLIPRLLTAAPGTRVVVLTSDTTDTALVNAVRAGAAGFLTKDKAIDDVVDAIGVVARGGTLLTERQRALAEMTPSPAAAPAAPARLAPAAAPSSADLRTLVGEARPASEPIEVRLLGIGSFAQAVLVEHFIDRVATVESVHIRDVDAGGASLGVTLAQGGSAEGLARALVEGSQRLRLASRSPRRVEIQVEAPLIDG
ncbi:MAG TPA: response regulator transcription factor [Candidatus Limnocylindria bacterium]|nr:response regulator transcription factor [Candidatus Limnocylindria bacterium]